MTFKSRHLNFLIFLIIYSFNSLDTCNGLRILGLFPYQGRSHYNMPERLLKALAAKGHQVDAYSHFPQKNSLPNFTDYSLAGSIHDVKDNVTYDTLLEYIKGSSSVKHWLKVAGTPACDQMSLPVFQNLIKNPPKDPPYDVIISDTCLSSCYIAWSYYLKVPMIDIVTSISYDWINPPRGNPVNYVTETSIFANTFIPTSFLERLHNYYTGISTELTFNWFVREQDESVKKYFGPGYPNAWDMHKDLALVFVNYQHAIHGPRAFVPSIIPVGGLHVQDDNLTLPQKLQTWLDESKDGFIYFSFGSMVRIETFPKHMIEAFYKAFESIAPVRVLWKIVNTDDLPPNLPKNVKTDRWLPQSQILKHKNIKAFITHGGLMSTYETIYHAVPTICIPLFADQHIHADLFVLKNVGIKVKLDEISVETFPKAVNQVLKNPEYKKNVIKLSQALKDLPMNPLDTAIFWVEYIARHGKNALRSPIVDLPWWQAHLLDIYIFIGSFLALILYVISKVIGLLIQTVLSVRCRSTVEKIKKN